MKPKYEKPQVIDLNVPKAWGDISPMGTCYAGTFAGEPWGMCESGASPAHSGSCNAGTSPSETDWCKDGGGVKSSCGVGSFV